MYWWSTLSIALVRFTGYVGTGLPLIRHRLVVAGMASAPLNRRPRTEVSRSPRGKLAPNYRIAALLAQRRDW